MYKIIKTLFLILLSMLSISNIDNAQTIRYIPNNDFEMWDSMTVIPTGWTADTSHGGKSSPARGLYRSDDHVSGNYSVELVSQPSPGFTFITSGKFDKLGHLSGGLPYQLSKDTLTGYYKYPIIAGADTAKIDVFLQKDGKIDSASSNSYLFSQSASWTYFELPINSGITPDTIRIDIYPSKSVKLHIGSNLYIDDLQLKSQPHTSGLFNPAQKTFAITAFPNPVQNQLNIRFLGIAPIKSEMKIYNSEGRLLIDNELNEGSSTITVPIDQLSAGLYYYEITTNGSIVRNKFVKSN